MVESVKALRAKLKHPDEEIDFAFDFSHMLRTGETIDSIAGVISSPEEDVELESRLVIDDEPEPEHAAPAVNTASFLDDEGTTVAVGKAVIVWVLGGVDGKAYRIKVRIETTLGRVLTLTGVLRIDDGDL